MGMPSAGEFPITSANLGKAYVLLPENFLP